MWILTALFDEAQDDDANFQKAKLLKTGKAYVLGRKDQPLIIKHPKISKSHAEFHVASCTEDDLLDPLFKPALRYVNKRDKPAKIDRGGMDVFVDPRKEEELHDGDTVWPIVSEKILVKWEALCCYYPPDENKVASIVQGCKSLGINLVHTPQSEVTHHLISTYTASASTALSLLSASQFVKPEWLQEIIRLGSPIGEDKPGASELENSFVLPPLSKYRPSFSPALQTSQKVYRVWEPNEERINLLKDYRIFLVIEIANATGSDMRDLIQRGGGSYECLDIHAGKSKWHKALVRGSAKDGKKLVLVGNKESLRPAVDENEWQDLLHEVEIFNLAFVSSEVVLQAIINVDTSALDVRSASGTVAQDGSHIASPEINSESQEHSPSLHSESQQRAASRQASVEPMESMQGPLLGDRIPRPRRPLTKRARALQDLPDIANTLPAVPRTEPVVAPIDFSAPAPLRSARLKRRREASEPVESSNTLRTSLGNGLQSSKRHKPLFEEGKLQDMDVDKMYSQLEASLAASQTQSQSAASGPVQSSAFPTLSVVREEEETQTTDNNDKGPKRRAESVDDETMPSKKRKHLGTNKATEEQVEVVVPESGTAPSSTIQTSTNKPDIDEAFLQAVSSTKRGKRKEDDFDRDFNKLKIARPELEHPEEEWGVVDDFGNETGMRGNFMVILEMDVPSKGNRTQHRMRSEWQELPNFKKFKKKNNMRSGTKVELVVSEENDYGLGPSYWKGSHAQQHGSQGSATQATQIKTETPPRNNEKGRNQALIINDSDEEFDAVQPVVEPTLRTESRTTKGRARAKTRNTVQPLFMESDNEKAMDGMDGTFEDSQEAPKARARTRSKKKAAVIVDDDSDDGAVFKGFKGKKRRT